MVIFSYGFDYFGKSTMNQTHQQFGGRCFFIIPYKSWLTETENCNGS